MSRNTFNIRLPALVSAISSLPPPITRLATLLELLDSYMVKKEMAALGRADTDPHPTAPLSIQAVGVLMELLAVIGICKAPTRTTLRIPIYDGTFLYDVGIAVILPKMFVFPLETGRELTSRPEAISYLAS